MPRWVTGMIVRATVIDPERGNCRAAPGVMMMVPGPADVLWLTSIHSSSASALHKQPGGALASSVIGSPARTTPWLGAFTWTQDVS